MLPEGVRVGVTSRSFAGGQAVDVTVRGWGDVRDRTAELDYRGDYPISEAAERINYQLRQIWGAYNYDGSDSQSDHFDVRYYGGVNFDGLSWGSRWTPQQS